MKKKPGKWRLITRPNSWAKQVRENRKLDFELHGILIHEMKNGEGKGGKYLEKKKSDDGRTNK